MECRACPEKSRGQVARWAGERRRRRRLSLKTLCAVYFLATRKCHPCWTRSGAPLLQWTRHVVPTWAACTRSTDTREADDSNHPWGRFTNKCPPRRPSGWAAPSRPRISSPRAALLAGQTLIFFGTALAECFHPCTSGQPG